MQWKYKDILATGPAWITKSNKTTNYAIGQATYKDILATGPAWITNRNKTTNYAIGQAYQAYYNACRELQESFYTVKCDGKR